MSSTALCTSLRLQIPCTHSLPTPHLCNSFSIRGVLRTQSKAINYFRKKLPSQILDRDPKLRLCLIICYSSQKVWGEVFHYWGYARKSWNHSVSKFLWLTPISRTWNLGLTPRTSAFFWVIPGTKRKISIYHHKNLDLSLWKSRPVIIKISNFYHESLDRSSLKISTVHNKISTCCHENPDRS